MAGTRTLHLTFPALGTSAEVGTGWLTATDYAQHRDMEVTAQVGDSDDVLIRIEGAGPEQRKATLPLVFAELAARLAIEPGSPTH